MKAANISNPQLVDKRLKPVNEEMKLYNVPVALKVLMQKLLLDDDRVTSKQNVKAGEENRIKSLNVPNNVNDKKDLSGINSSKSVGERLEVKAKYWRMQRRM